MTEYQLLRSKRKSIAIEISQNLTLIVRAPNRMPQKEIDRFVARHQEWIEHHLAICAQRKSYKQYTSAEEAALYEKAKTQIPVKVAFYSRRMGLTPTGIKITSARTRFGSCSGKNSLCFSWRLMDYPDDAIDYVVVHELAHILHKNHGAAFYALVARYLPDYKQRIALLKK